MKLNVQNNYSRIINNSQMVETQMFLKGQINEQVMIYTYNGILLYIPQFG